MTVDARSGQPLGQQINIRQNESAKLEMLAAADVKHAESQRLEAVRAAFALLLSTGSILATILHWLAPAIALVGFVGAIAVYLLSFVSSSMSSAAAKIQEHFDCSLFLLTPTVGSTPFPSTEEIRRLARRYGGSPKVDWYVNVTDLPMPYAVLLCQRENLQWDWPLRRNWARRVLVAASLWVGLGLVIALIADWTVRELLVRWLAPSLPSLIMATEVVRVNRSIATKKQSLALEVEEALGVLPVVGVGETLSNDEAQELTRKCETFQGRIFRLRDSAQRVPGRIFRKHKDDDETDARAAADLLRSRLLGLND